MNKYSNDSNIKFTEETLVEILKKDNMQKILDCFNSHSVFEMHCGPQHTSKLFYNALISVYKLINGDDFNGIWYTNNENKSKNILKPMFLSVINFLKDKWNLDFSFHFKVTERGIFYVRGDAEIGRGIYFETWNENFTFNLVRFSKTNFSLSELVLVDLVNNETAWHSDAQKSEQEKQLSTLISYLFNQQHLSGKANLKVKFIYSIHTTNHFLIEKFHNEVIKVLDHKNTIKKSYVDKLLEKGSIYLEKQNFKNGLGGILIHSTKLESTEPKTHLQKSYFEYLQKYNEEMYYWGALGIYPSRRYRLRNYYLYDAIFKGKSDYDWSLITEVENLKDHSIVEICDSFNIGKRNKISWVRIAKLTSNKILVLEAIESLEEYKEEKKIIENDIKVVLEKIALSNARLLQNYNSKLSEELSNNFKTKFVTDNTIAGRIAEGFKDFIDKEHTQTINVILTFCFEAIFSQWQKDKQEWEKNAFYRDIVLFSSHYLGNEFINKFSKMVVSKGKTERDNQINADVYDLVEGFELAVFGTSVKK